MRNEKGASLLMVLGIVVILFTLGIALSSMTLATRMQYNKTDNLNAATDIAEMGITHYQTLIESLVASANANAVSVTKAFYDSKNNNSKPTDSELQVYYRANFCSKLFSNQETVYNYKINQTIDQSRNVNYVITVKNLEGTCLTNDNVKLNFISLGNNGKQSKSVNGVLTISKLGLSSSLQPNTSIPGKDKYSVYTLPVNLKGTDKQLSLDTSTWFEKTVSISGNKKPLYVKGNVFFQDLVSTNGNIMMTIEGDVIFNKGISVNGNPKNICITGKTYTVDSNNKLVAFDFNNYNKCSNPNSDYYSKYGWTTDQIPLSVSY